MNVDLFKDVVRGCETISQRVEGFDGISSSVIEHIQHKPDMHLAESKSVNSTR